MRLLEAGQVAPASGRAASAVVLLHGYGADHTDLLGLARPLAAALPDTLFAAPNAPDPCRLGPGFQWFPIPAFDGATEADAETALLASAADLDGFLDALAATTGVPAARTALLGFSQGTMMALHVAPRRGEALAGVAGFSGRLLLPERLEAEARTRPPVLLVHGAADRVVLPFHLAEAEGGLRAAGFAVEAMTSPGTAHGIAPDGLARAAAFLAARLS